MSRPVSRPGGPAPVDWPAPSDRAGWHGSQLSKAQISVDLGDEQRHALRGLVDEVRRAGIPLGSIERSHFAHPALDRTLHAVALEVRQGSGLAFLRGIPVEDYTTDELRIAFWGVSTYFGLPLSQSGRGDRLGEVVARPRADGKRGYTSDQELHYHNDLTEMFGLFCIQPARAGGENLFASMLAAYAILKSRRPEHLAVLERGFRLDRTPDSPQFDVEPLSPHPIPLFSMMAGLRSCWLTLPERAERCARTLGLELNAAERAALDCLSAIVHESGFAFKARLEPGEAVFVNNYEVVHARTPLVQYDDPERRRHLLRIWLEDDPPRPMHPHLSLYQNASGLQGIDPRPRNPSPQRGEGGA